MLIYMAMIDSPEDQSKFERVYHKYRYLMLHIAKQILHNHHDAEDAVHQAFVAIIENIEKISDVDSPKTRSFVVIISERKAIDMLRSNSRRSTVELNEDIAGIEMHFDLDNPVAAAIAKLPVHYREVLLLRFDNGFTTKEIASMMNITDSGVRKLIARAKRALQEILEKEGEAV